MSTTGLDIPATSIQTYSPREALLEAIQGKIVGAPYYSFNVPAPGGLDALHCYAGVIGEGDRPHGEVALAVGATSFIRILTPGTDRPHRAYKIDGTTGRHIDTEAIVGDDEYTVVAGLVRATVFDIAGSTAVMQALRSRRNVMAADDALGSFLRSTKPLQ